MEKKTRSYLQLTKPGITISNTMTAVAGYFLASSTIGFDGSIFVAIIIGVATIIASACVVNNVLDRNIDKRMKRTAKRVLVSGSILPVQALLFAGVLAVIGFYSLAAYTNILTTLLGVLAYIWYIAIYGLAKRTTAYSTIIGGLAGALPPVAGYVSMVGHIDSAAIILFILMQVWQMPHFYAIALFRAKEYKAAKLPIWSVTHGLRKTKQQILIYIVLFVFTAPLLGIYGYIGNVAVVMLTAVAAYWLVRAVKTYNKLNDDAWARSMFGVSLIVLLVMSAMIGVGGYLP